MTSHSKHYVDCMCNSSQCIACIISVYQTGSLVYKSKADTYSHELITIMYCLRTNTYSITSYSHHMSDTTDTTDHTLIELHELDGSQGGGG